MKHCVSIVIPVLNEAPQLTATLNALQPLRNRCQLIVVDGGSHDGSPEQARPWVDKVLAGPRGRAAQMNCGAKASDAGVLLFLHADTGLPDDAIDAILDALAAGYHWGRFDVRLDAQAPVFRLIAAMMNRRSRLTGIATGDQGIFVRREMFEAVGGIPAIALMEDIALSKQLKKQGKPACLRTTVLTSARRWQQHGIARTILLMWWLRLAYFFGADPDALAARYYRRS